MTKIKGALRNLTLAAAAVALVTSLPAPAKAGGKDAFIGGIVGFGAGYLAGQNSKNRTKQRRKTTVRTNRRTVSPAQREAARQKREENRKIQITLAQLGCDPGTPDGVFGKKTRAAVRCFQDQFKQPVTGKLTTEQRVRLLITYDKVLTDGPIVVESPEPYGKPKETEPADQVVVDNKPQLKKDKGAVVDKLDEERRKRARRGIRNVRTVMKNLLDTDVQSLPDVVDDMDADQQSAESVTDQQTAESVTMMQYCDRQLAPAAASFTPTPAKGSDSMAKRFCALQEAVVREAQGIEFAPGYSVDAMWNECMARAQQSETLLSAVSTTGPGNLMTDLRTTYNYSDASIRSAYTWCVSAAYQSNAPRVSLASALALFAMKDHGYGELVAGHLALGFGTFANQGLAAKWLEITASSISEDNPTIDGRPVDEAVEEMMALSERYGSSLSQMAQQRSVDYYNSLKVGANFDQIFNLTGDDIYQICADVATIGDAAYGHDGVKQVFSKVCRIIGHSYGDDSLIAIYDRPVPSDRPQGDATLVNHTTKTY